MKKTVAFLCVVFVLSIMSCKDKCDPEEFLSQVKSIRLVEESVTRHLIVNAGIEDPNRAIYFQNVPLDPVPISSKSSNIVIEDTIGFLTTPGELEVEPSESGANVYISLNVQPGSYYCQRFEDGKMTCERGLIGTHLNKRGLIPLDTFPASNHFASAVSQNSIHVLKNNPPPTTVKQYNTEGKTIYVCNENGKLVISEKPEL